jgi:hypothetical protein
MAEYPGVSDPHWARRGGTGWLWLVAAILTWDLLAEEDQTLSDAFRRTKSRPARAVAAGTAWGLLTAHLWGVLPSRADPFHVIHVVRCAVRRRA